jgi:signal transduction histidine kinase
MNDSMRVLHLLGERVKELSALHRTARILQDETRPVAETLTQVVSLLPAAWQYPESTRARIVFDGSEFATTGFASTDWSQQARFKLQSGEEGLIEVCYTVEMPHETEGPFLAEERDLIDSLAEMLRSYLQHKKADDTLKKAHDSLEQLVRQRTAELQTANKALRSQVDEYRRAQKQIEAHQRELSRLTSELSLAEARERRLIAGDLHDHIGQALAFIKMKVSLFQGNAVFCGFEDSLAEILTLLDQTISYTRNLTFELSPPVLYELGLTPAIEWLAESLERRHGLRTVVRTTGLHPALPDDLKVVLFKSVQEALNNVTAHAAATEAAVTVSVGSETVTIQVRDNGKGFNPDTVIASDGHHFGLFSIRERLGYLGGSLKIDSTPGNGTTLTLTAPYHALREDR